MKKPPKGFVDAVKSGKVVLPSGVDPKLFKEFTDGVKKGEVQLNYLGSRTIKQGQDTIFMLASMQDKGERKRTWGFVMTEKEARDAMAENAGDMCEANYYQYAIIEKLWSGIFCSRSEVIGWYKWVGSAETGSWKPIKAPAWAKGIFNWTL